MAISYEKRVIRISNVTEGKHTYVLKKSQSGYTNANICRVTIVGLPTCNDSLIVYYLDDKGEYRSFVFSRYFEIVQDVTESNYTRERMPNTLNGFSDKRSTRAKVEKKIKAVAEGVPTEQIEYLRQIAYSPRIFLKVGANFNESSFVLVTCKADASVFQTKRKFTDFSCEFTLPTFNTIG